MSLRMWLPLMDEYPDEYINKGTSSILTINSDRYAFLLTEKGYDILGGCTNIGNSMSQHYLTSAALQLTSNDLYDIFSSNFTISFWINFTHCTADGELCTILYINNFIRIQYQQGQTP